MRPPTQISICHPESSQRQYPAKENTSNYKLISLSLETAQKSMENPPKTDPRTIMVRSYRKTINRPSSGLISERTWSLSVLRSVSLEEEDSFQPEPSLYTRYSSSKTPSIKGFGEPSETGESSSPASGSIRSSDSFETDPNSRMALNSVDRPERSVLTLFEPALNEDSFLENVVCDCLGAFNDFSRKEQDLLRRKKSIGTNDDQRGPIKGSKERWLLGESPKNLHRG